ncbi:hypothetical protein SapgrDRAFT_2650 [Saprospira grandis DSM 2844]|uniref:DUF7793 domain-containing protein n=1 Tax=Saprospira grandis DSM 2844 TaxID=694433 RepID=J0XYS0_9BACT|nr:hypothetical protein [Saprospira grandis]EJF54306.1 hypothetical protein SapgrDRAFT_2650 [Saprospira grandis DSM 2844]
MKKEVNTSLARVWALSPNLMKEVYYKTKVHDMELVREHIRLCHETFGLGKYYITDIRLLKSASREAREYLRDHSGAAAAAIIVGGGLSKMLGNMYMSFSKPLYPSRIFQDEKKAIAWLVEQGAEAPKK